MTVAIDLLTKDTTEEAAPTGSKEDGIKGSLALKIEFFRFS